ncbi:MAG: homocysteine S-methyltransferase family protein [Thermoanaerobaculales bacterium]
MRPSEFVELLHGRVVMLDGGLGSMLIAAGLAGGRAPEWWNLEHPDRVAAVHRAYVEAGSEIIHANTFGANPARLAAVGLAGRCHEVNAAAVSLAREACAGRAWVAGDVGPTGKMLPPLGSATVSELRSAFDEQVEALTAAGADLISIETMSDLREALVAVEAARAVGLAVHASMTFAARRRGTFTIMGNALVPSLAALAKAGADAVGCNCTVVSAEMRGMIEEAASHLAVPISAQPNAGQPRLTPDGVVYDADPIAFARDIVAMVACGARAVGGCCGTTPEFIACIRSALEAGKAG